VQTHLVIENIFDKTELAKHIAQLTALMHLGETKVEQAASVVVTNLERAVTKAPAVLPSVDSSAKEDLALAHTLFGTGDGSTTNIPLAQASSPAASTAAVETSTTAPAAPPVTSAPPPPVAAPAPPAPPAVATQAPASTGETDRNGYTHDERIHASTKTKNADGTWRYKRGVADTLVETVEAAQRAARGAVFGPVTVTIDPAPGNGDRVTVTAEAQVAPPSPNAAPPVFPAAPAAPGVTFGALVKRTQEVMRVGKWMVLDMQNALKSIGLPDFPSLQSRPDLFDQFNQLLTIAELTEK
jgi:hypothetical protein